MKRERCSVTIITLNEEKNLRDCLESVRWADEIVIVDSGSTDGTLRIAQEFHCQIVHNPWPGMREQKNIASAAAVGPWILNLDADERLSSELQDEVQQHLADPKFDGYSFPRKNIFLGHWMRHGGWYPDSTLRLFRKGQGRFGGINPHSNVELPQGARVTTLEYPLVHFTYYSLAQYVSKQYTYADAAARELYETGRLHSVSSVRIWVKTFWKFIETYFIKRGFLDGTHGLIAALGATFGAYLKQARVWELSRQSRKNSAE
ncbi:MAG: glycosyltransferase family 2 protein [Limisphaerales bacterium]